jgi:mRNA-degrading endonuclease RelE of RelBE toxin-antitoxin system
VYEKLPPDVRARLRKALETLARNVAGRRRLGGKAVKTLHGLDDTFHRLRVGDYRVMYDVLTDDRVVLVLGIVHRRDLERWIRAR